MSNEVVPRTAPNPPLPHTSPYNANSLGAFVLFRTDNPQFKDKRQEFADSNANMGFYLAIEDFIAAFTPITQSNHGPVSASRKPYQMPDKIVDMIKEAGKAKSERMVAEAWHKWFNPPRKNAVGPCPGYRLALSQDRWDKGDAEKLKVDGAIHRQDELPTDGRPHWESQRVLFEFKRGTGSLDPYDDHKKGDAEAETRVDVRGQVTSYAAHAFARQHRTAMFLCLVNGQKMRATRWDRSGTVFSASFNYIKQRDTLRRLLWGFSRLSDQQQGIDETAVLLIPTDDDYIAMTKAQDKNKTDISEVEGTVVEGEGPWTFRFVRELFKNSLEGDCPRYRLMVPCKDGPQYFLVGNPVFVAPGMSGRGTRCYVAYDRPKNRFVFLKDAWRPASERVETEGEVLRQLRDAKVRNIPTIVCDGELEQQTATPIYVTKQHAADGPADGDPASGEGVDENDMDYGEVLEEEEEAVEEEYEWTDDEPPSVPASPGNASVVMEEEEDRAKPDVEALPPQGPTPSAFQNRGQHLVRTFRHYRLVVEEVCMGLTAFRSGKQLMSIIRDCVRAHADAVEKKGIVHRDVSGGNILICPTVVCDPKDNKRRVVWKGILTDWELSKPLPGKDEVESARQATRTGTWQFTSAWILDNPEDAVRTADDVESFFHVSLYMGLRYMRHNCNNLQMTMFDYFDSYSYDAMKERYLCGLHKQMSMVNGRLRDAGKTRFYFLDDDNKPNNHPLDQIFDVMLEWFKERYDHLTRIPRSSEKLPVDDHTALLQLLDSKLDDPAPGKKATVWPEKDKVGDQLKPEKKHGSDGADKGPRAKRAKTTGGARASGSGSSRGAARAPPPRTRGNRLKRGVGSSGSRLTRS